MENGKIFNYYGNEVYEIKEGNGKWKEYNNNRKLLFEGEYLNGKRKADICSIQ